MTTVGLLGGGPAMAAVRAALEDTAATSKVVQASTVDETDVAVAIGPVGDGVFHGATETATGTGTPLLVVELGGVGETRVAGVEAAISGYAPGTACYECLCGRVEAAGPDTDAGEYEAPTARLAGALAGRELASLVGGGQSTVVGGVLELPHASRRVLPLPFCECGEPAAVELSRHHEDRALEQSLAMAEAAFDARVGPITNVGEAESFPVPYYLATLADAPFSDGDVPGHAAGVALEWDPAFMKALGEALERYGAAIYRTDRFETDPRRPVDPGQFVQSGDGTETVDYWHPAEHLGTGASVHLPAELVVFPPPERGIRPAITTGLGLGNGGVDALLSGLYEVLERDAAMLSWYSTYEPLGLDVDDEGFETLAARAESEGLEATALLLTQDVDVPVVAACVHRDGDWPQFAAGMSADLNPGAAARGALEEAVQNWLELRRMGPDRAGEQSGAIGHYASSPPAARAFVDPETTIPAADVGPATVPDGAAELEALVERALEAGLDVYGSRLTPRDVEHLGFEVVRVVVPAAQPLFTDDAYFGERAREVPRQLGFEPRLEREHHPFP